MSLCECGCGNELGTSPSLYFRWNICQCLWSLSQHHPDPDEWRERERENLIFASDAPFWAEGVIVADLHSWPEFVRRQYRSAVWTQEIGLDISEADPSWLPTLEQVMPYMIKDWHVNRQSWERVGYYGDQLYEPKFLIPATV